MYVYTYINRLFCIAQSKFHENAELCLLFKLIAKLTYIAWHIFGYYQSICRRTSSHTLFINEVLKKCVYLKRKIIFQK